MRILLVGAILTTISVARAAEPAEPASRRELAGHLFIPSFNVPDPFVPTALSLEVGAGYSDVTTIFPLATNVPVLGSGSYRTAVTTMTAQFQATLTRWLGLRASGASVGYIGTSSLSAAAVGSQLAADVDVGLTAGGQLGRMVRLAGLFDFDYRNMDEITPIKAIAQSQATGQLNTDQTKTQATIYHLQPGVTVAVAPVRALGLVAAVQYDWAHQTGNVREVTVHRFAPGIAIDFDLGKLAPQVPLGIMASYRLQFPISSTEHNMHDLDGGLFYTGRRDLAVGALVRGRWLELRPGFDAPTLTVSAVLRYFWN